MTDCCLMCSDFLYGNTLIPCVTLFQFEAAGFYLWAGGEFTDGPATHDPESRVPCHQLHASAIVQRPPDNRGAWLVPWTYKVPCYLS